MKAWLNRHFTHERDKTGDYGYRVFIHIPIGLLIGVPVLGLPLLKLFVEYQKNEDRWCEDQPWKDYPGAMIGVVVTELLVLGGITWATLTLLGG